jgi:hypothetical protein
MKLCGVTAPASHVFFSAFMMEYSTRNEPHRTIEGTKVVAAIEDYCRKRFGARIKIASQPKAKKVRPVKKCAVALLLILNCSLNANAALPKFGKSFRSKRQLCRPWLFCPLPAPMPAIPFASTCLNSALPTAFQPSSVGPTKINDRRASPSQASQE